MAAPLPYLQLLRREWRFLGFGFWLTFLSSLGQTYFIFVFNDDVRAAFDLSDGDYGGCYAVATLASAFTLVHVGRMIDKVRLVRWTLAVCLAGVVACVLMSTASSIVMLIVALFALRFSGQGLMGHTAFTSMGRYYEAQRGKAVSIAALGFAAGNGVFPGLGVALLDAMTWREAWALMGGVLLVGFMPLALWLLRGHDERHAGHVARLEARNRPRDVDDEDEPEVDEPRQFTRGEVLRDPRFYLLVPGLVSPTFILTGLIFHQRRLAEQKDWSVEWVATCFVAYAIAVSISSLWSGRAVDKLGARRLAVAYLVPLALALVVVASFEGDAVAMIYLVLAGLTAGAGGPVVGSLWAELYGVLHLGAIRSISSSLMVVSTALAPFLLGWLLDEGVGMNAQSWGCLVYMVLGMLGIAVALRRPAPATR